MTYYFGTDLHQVEIVPGDYSRHPQHTMAVIAPTEKAARTYMRNRFGMNYCQYDDDRFIPWMQKLHQLGQRAKFLEFVEVDREGLLVDRYTLPTEILVGANE